MDPLKIAIVTNPEPLVVGQRLRLRVRDAATQEPRQGQWDIPYGVLNPDAGPEFADSFIQIEGATLQDHQPISDEVVVVVKRPGTGFIRCWVPYGDGLGLHKSGHQFNLTAVAGPPVEQPVIPTFEIIATVLS